MIDTALAPIVGARAQQKMLNLVDLAAEISRLKSEGKTVAQCHGVFDLLHIGHIWHLKEAKAKADIVIVTITPDEYVNKGPHRPAFSEQLRAEALAALDMVDYVAVNEWPTAIEAIKLLQPNFYVKGPDYKNATNDRTGKITDEEDAVRSVGGIIYFTEGQTHSSTQLLNEHFSAQSEETKEFLQQLRKHYSLGDIIGIIEDLSKVRVLVVGEAIIDEYQYCEAIGKSSKEPTLVVKVGKKEMFTGGALAIANHASGFAGATGVATLLGDSNDLISFAREHTNPGIDWYGLVRAGAPTIVKRRYIDQYFFSKLFETYELRDDHLSADDEEAVVGKLREVAGEYDMVLVADYGHEFFTDKIASAVVDTAKFLAVNVQSNAGSLGYQSLRKYAGADFFSIDEAELRLEARNRRGKIEPLIAEVGEDAGGKTMFVTRGKFGSVCWRPESELLTIPPITGKVIDRVGAGDAFLTITALCAQRGVPTVVAGFLGNVAGAMAVATVGNKKPVKRLDLIRAVESLLK